MSTSIVLSKVSLQYASGEDRIRMTARVGESDIVVFWLTLRICQKMVGMVARYVEKSTQVPAGSDKELVLSFQQSAAMVRKEPADPVVADGETRSVLVERVDIAFNKGGAALAFFIPGGTVAQIPLSASHARQWLGILRGQYQQAGWPLDAWPAWFSETADKSKSGGKAPRMH